MELSSAIVTTPPLDAASVVLLRDGAPGLEVLLLRRHSQSAVLGGAWVFAGGKVDAADSALVPLLDQPATALHTALNEPALSAQAAGALHVAAIREAFEECGVLLATAAAPQGQPAATPVWQQAVALLQAGHGFAALLQTLSLVLDTRSLAPWTRWITPRMPSHAMGKRFDTRFFVAALPPGQEARHDAYETTETLWLTPRAALQRYWDGQLPMAPPQLMSLVQLARHASVAAVLQAARALPPPTIEPEPQDLDGERIICYPGDALHAVAGRALPGPTRLVHRNGRFEPWDGFAALFT